MKSIKNIYNFFDVSLLSNETQGSFRGTFGIVLQTVLEGVIAVCYVIETCFSRPNWGQIGFHILCLNSWLFYSTFAPQFCWWLPS